MTCRNLFGLLALTTFWFACSATPDRADEIVQTKNDSVPKDGGAGAVAAVDRVEIVHGVPDRGRDPAVIALRIGGEGYCTGTLVASNIVLTARHCVSDTIEAIACPAEGVQVGADRRASDLEVLLGEDFLSGHAAAHGRQIVAPNGVTLCDADIALVILDAPIKSIRPLGIRARGPAVRDYVRAVGYGRPGDDDPAGRKLLREHVRVLGVSAAELQVGEATCSGDSGGPALDEDTGEVVGVVSRGGPSCDGAGVHNVYTRVDTYAWLVKEAFARAGELDADDKADAGSSADPVTPKPGTKQKPPSDVGGACETGADCAAGICITAPDDGEPLRRYCSRPCGTGDRCPTSYHCESVQGGQACVNVR